MSETSLIRKVDQATGEISEFSSHTEEAAAAAREEAEIKALVISARRFPRSLDQFEKQIKEICARPTFAQKAYYLFHRYDSKKKKKVPIHGPSVHLLKACGTAYQNIRWGFDIIHHDGERAKIRAVAWDMQNNVYSFASGVTKLVQPRRDKVSGETVYVEANQRDQRMIIHAQAAILVRNCLNGVVPSDLVQDALSLCYKTLKGQVKDIKATRVKIKEDLEGLGVSDEQIRDWLANRHNKETYEFAEATERDCIDLIGLINSITDGHTTVEDAFPVRMAIDPAIEEKKETEKVDAEKVEAGSDKQHEDHEPQPSDEDKPNVQHLKQTLNILNSWVKQSGGLGGLSQENADAVRFIRDEIRNGKIEKISRLKEIETWVNKQQEDSQEKSSTDKEKLTMSERPRSLLEADILKWVKEETIMQFLPTQIRIRELLSRNQYKKMAFTVLEKKHNEIEKLIKENDLEK